MTSNEIRRLHRTLKGLPLQDRIISLLSSVIDCEDDRVRTLAAAKLLGGMTPLLQSLPEEVRETFAKLLRRSAFDIEPVGDSIH